MSDTIRNENDPIIDAREGHVPPEAVEGAHDADGTMGKVAGTGTGLLSGALVGSAAGPVGTVVGAVAGALLGNAAGKAAHHIGDDQDDVNIETGSGGDLGKAAGAGAGGPSGAIIGSAAGPGGAVAGAVAGGVLGAAAGNAAKDMGGDPDNPNVVPTGYVATEPVAVAPVAPAYPSTVVGTDPIVGTTPDGTDYTASTLTPPTARSYSPEVTTTPDAPASPTASVPGTYIGSGIGAGSVTGTPGIPMGTSAPDPAYGDDHGHNVVTGQPSTSEAGNVGLGTGAVVGGLIGTAVGGPVGAVIGGAVGSLAGGVAGDAAEASEDGNDAVGNITPVHDYDPDLAHKRKLEDDDPGVQIGGAVSAGEDTRGYIEKAADALTGDRIDDKTGGVVGTGYDTNVGSGVGNSVPGIQTGGTNADGTPDTRGVTEKAADVITGDKIDDKTGRRI